MKIITVDGNLQLEGFLATYYMLYYTLAPCKSVEGIISYQLICLLNVINW